MRHLFKEQVETVIALVFAASLVVAVLWSSCCTIEPAPEVAAIEERLGRVSARIDALQARADEAEVGLMHCMAEVADVRSWQLAMLGISIELRRVEHATGEGKR